MIFRKNLTAVAEQAAAAARVLDVGGWYQPFNLATHVIDISPFDTRRTHEALLPEQGERFTADTWIIHDVCSAPWPFPDNYFDFCFCSHLLEDVRDPIAVCREMTRVCRAGYIETPSRVREIYSKARLFSLKAALGRMPEVGFNHHRWFCEMVDNHVRFFAKDQRMLLDRSRYITRSELGRKLTETESGCAMFWSESFAFEEIFEFSGADLAVFKKMALEGLRRT